MTKQGLNTKSSESKLRTFSTLPISLPEQLRYLQPSTYNIISSFSYSRLEKRQPEHLLYKRPSHAHWEKHVDIVSEALFSKVWVCCCCGYSFSSNPTFCLPWRMKRPTKNRMWYKGNRESQKEWIANKNIFYWSFSFSSTWWKWYLGSQELLSVGETEEQRAGGHRAQLSLYLTDAESLTLQLPYLPRKDPHYTT